jgi:hypothetical protein
MLVAVADALNGMVIIDLRLFFFSITMRCVAVCVPMMSQGRIGCTFFFCLTSPHSMDLLPCLQPPFFKDISVYASSCSSSFLRLFYPCCGCNHARFLFLALLRYPLMVRPRRTPQAGGRERCPLSGSDTECLFPSSSSSSRF